MKRSTIMSIQQQRVDELMELYIALNKAVDESYKMVSSDLDNLEMDLRTLADSIDKYRNDRG